MKLIAAIVFATITAFAQVAPVTGPATSTTVVSANLPSIAVGAGPSWTRGAAYAAAANLTVAIHIGTSNWYSWSNVSTPINTAPAVGAPPVASSITTGGAWVAAQSSTGSVMLVTIVQAGFTQVQATSTMAPAFTGSIGVAFKLGKRPIWVMPYAAASNTSTATGGGALATAVFQPGIMLLYGFGSK